MFGHCNLLAYIPWCPHSEEAGLCIKRIQSKTHLTMNLHIIFSGQVKRSILDIISQNISRSVRVTLVSQKTSLKRINCQVILLSKPCWTCQFQFVPNLKSWEPKLSLPSPVDILWWTTDISTFVPLNMPLVLPFEVDPVKLMYLSIEIASMSSYILLGVHSKGSSTVWHLPEMKQSNPDIDQQWMAQRFHLVPASVKRQMTSLWVWRHRPYVLCIDANRTKW